MINAGLLFEPSGEPADLDFSPLLSFLKGVGVEEKGVGTIGKNEKSGVKIGKTGLETKLIKISGRQLQRSFPPSRRNPLQRS